MSNLHTLAVAALLPLASMACSSALAAPTATSGATVDAALGRDKAASALAAIPESGTDCRIIAAVGLPIAVMHLEDAKIQQSAGRLRLSSYGSGARDGDRVLEGTAVATIIGKQPSGELLANHHLLFAEGTLRTENDVVAITPTSDKCVVTAKAKLYFHDGTGEFAGLSGTGVAEASLNFCGAPGRAVVYGRVCKAAK